MNNVLGRNERILLTIAVIAACVNACMSFLWLPDSGFFRDRQYAIRLPFGSEFEKGQLKGNCGFGSLQAIVEHPYGTFKRQGGFNYIMTKKTIKRATADVGLMFTAYNLRRILNIIGKEGLRRFWLEFLVFLTSFLASWQLFWRMQKKSLPKLSRKLAFLTTEVFANLAG